MRIDIFSTRWPWYVQKTRILIFGSFLDIRENTGRSYMDYGTTGSLCLYVFYYDQFTRPFSYSQYQRNWLCVKTRIWKSKRPIVCRKARKTPLMNGLTHFMLSLRKIIASVRGSIFRTPWTFYRFESTTQFCTVSNLRQMCFFCVSKLRPTQIGLITSDIYSDIYLKHVDFLLTAITVVVHRFNVQ